MKLAHAKLSHPHSLGCLRRLAPGSRLVPARLSDIGVKCCRCWLNFTLLLGAELQLDLLDLRESLRSDPAIKDTRRGLRPFMRYKLQCVSRPDYGQLLPTATAVCRCKRKDRSGDPDSALPGRREVISPTTCSGNAELRLKQVTRRTSRRHRLDPRVPPVIYRPAAARCKEYALEEFWAFQTNHWQD